ncbi:MAG TPA: 6-phosphofructokinase [Candidatus Dorea faecigallinarum]|nr:6-phosphofructokinase [Candidatus Dorea faecigallinarum]
MAKMNLIVGQSGGPTAVINSSLYGVVSEGLAHSDEIGEVYGMVNGIEGFLEDRILNFREALPGDKLEYLKHTPGAYLGSCRYKLPESLEDPVYPLLFEKFEKLNIGWFFYIGGNDSMDTVSKLSRYAAKINSPVRVIGEPKTIDNDLVNTDHTPGYGSAAKYVASTIREIVLDASVYEKKSVTIVEIMGRHAGWLTAAGVLARKYEGDNPRYIYLPESDFDTENFLKDIEKALEKDCCVVVCVSEGIHDADGTFICEYDSSVGTDTFGHKMLAGCGKYLENLVRERLGVKARSVELNVSQRCSASLISAADQKEAVAAGRFGVQAALDGVTGKMVSFIRRTEADGTVRIECGLEDVNAICNEEKTVPADWIINNGSDVSEKFLQYVLPLVQGRVEVPLGEDGLPVFVYRK